MSHAATDRSGVLDPGEWIRLEPVDARSQVRSFYEAREEGYRVGSDFGDVISYLPSGSSSSGSPGSPGFPLSDEQADVRIVHRAIAWVEYNETADAYDVPRLGIHGERSITLSGVGSYDRAEDRYVHRSFTVQLLPNRSGRHDGFLTKGDHNAHLDQHATGGLEGIGHVELVTVERMEGKVVGHVDGRWIRAVQIGVPIAALAVAGGVYLWRRGRLDDVASKDVEACDECGRAFEGDEAFCVACGAQR